MILLASRRRLAAVLTLGLVFALGSPAAAQPSGDRDASAPTGSVVHSWALMPGDGTNGERTNFSYDLAPGSETKDVATLFNLSNVPLTFFVYGTDAFNTDDGTFDLLPFEKKPKDVGTWFDLPDGAAITLAPRKQATFPFTIRVPLDARPGDHVGALLASSAALGTSPKGDTITVDRRTGARVYVRVAGPLEPQLTVEKLRTRFEPGLNPLDGTAKVTYRIENRGNVRLGAKHRVSMGGPFGLLATTSKTQELEELLPGEGVTVSTTLNGVSATALAFTEVDLDVVPLAEGDQALETVHARAFLFALPFTVLALFVVAALGWFARRSYLRHRDDLTGRESPAWP